MSHLNQCSFEKRGKGYFPSRTRCENKGKVERNGKWFCGVHDPLRREERTNANFAKWRKKMLDTVRVNRIKDAAPQLLKDALDTDHAYSWLLQELRDLKADGSDWDEVYMENFATSLIAYCEAHQIGTRAAIAAAKGETA